jgi:NTE family protein
VRFGLGLATDFQGENYFNILAQYRRTWLNRLGGEWLSEVQVGKNTFFSSEFIQPIEERGRYFVAPHVKFSQDLRGVFFGDQRVGEYQTNETRLGLDGGALFARIWFPSHLAPPVNKGWKIASTLLLVRARFRTETV